MFDLFAARRPQAMPVRSAEMAVPYGLYVSLCNTAAGAAHLLRLSPDGTVEATSLPGREVRGVTGMARYGDGWILAVQMRRGGGVMRIGGGVSRIVGLEDAHGLAVQGDSLYAVATGDDRVLTLNGALTVTRRMAPFGRLGADIHHINDICVHEGRLIVSAFGARQPDSLRNGGVFALDGEGAATRLFGGLNDPHSVTSTAEGLFVVDSRTGDVLRLYEGGYEKMLSVQGYARGLCVTAEHILVGISAQRCKSRSTQRVNGGRLYGDVACERAARRCGIYVYERRTGQGRFVDLSAYGPEIYQIAKV